MENNESNIKPQQTGGLKLMTVFVVVLALHVVVIGGMTAYYMLKGPSADVDLTDKTTKAVKITPDGTIVGDTTSSDSAQGDKTASTAPADNSGTAASTPASSTEPVPAPQADKAPATTIVSTPNIPAPTAATPTGPVISPIAPMMTSPLTSTAASTPAVTAPNSLVESGSYVVKLRDSLPRIAHKNHVSVAALKAANGLTNETLHVGQKLVIPAKGEVASTTTTKTDLTGTPANLTEATPMTTAAKIKSAPAAVTPDLTTASHHVYTVVKGDTLSKIAHKFKTTTKALMAANSLSDAAKLSIGEKLKIPSKEARSAMNVPAPTPARPSEVQAKPVTTAPPATTVQPATTTQPATTAQLANFVQ